MKKIIAVLIVSAFSCSLLANISLPKIFGDNMVLQRDKPVRIWGWAAAGENVTLQFNQQKKNTKADKAGKWQILLAPVAVRYNWTGDASEGNLFNQEMLPAAPFRTDNWDGVTIKNRYIVNQ